MQLRIVIRSSKKLHAFNYLPKDDRRFMTAGLLEPTVYSIKKQAFTKLWKPIPRIFRKKSMIRWHQMAPLHGHSSMLARQRMNTKIPQIPIDLVCTAKIIKCYETTKLSNSDWILSERRTSWKWLSEINDGNITAKCEFRYWGKAKYLCGKFVQISTFCWYKHFWSFDRFTAIIFVMSPWLRLSKRRAKYLVLITWIFAITMAAPLFIVNQVQIKTFLHFIVSATDEGTELNRFRSCSSSLACLPFSNVGLN